VLIEGDVEAFMEHYSEVSSHLMVTVMLQYFAYEEPLHFSKF